jgi:hypothetical protein
MHNSKFLVHAILNATTLKKFYIIMEINAETETSI